MSPLRGGGVSLGAVSYTHLDVYKRQDYTGGELVERLQALGSVKQICYFGDHDEFLAMLQELSGEEETNDADCHTAERGPGAQV